MAAERETRLGTRVRYLRSIFISEDETWFLVYEAARVEAVCDADLSFDRVTGAVEA